MRPLVKLTHVRRWAMQTPCPGHPETLRACPGGEQHLQELPVELGFGSIRELLPALTVLGSFNGRGDDIGCHIEPLTDGSRVGAGLEMSAVGRPIRPGSLRPRHLRGRSDGARGTSDQAPGNAGAILSGRCPAWNQPQGLPTGPTMLHAVAARRDAVGSLGDPLQSTYGVRHSGSRASAPPKPPAGWRPASRPPGPCPVPPPACRSCP